MCLKELSGLARCKGQSKFYTFLDCVWKMSVVLFPSPSVLNQGKEYSLPLLTVTGWGSTTEVDLQTNRMIVINEAKPLVENN